MTTSQHTYTATLPGGRQVPIAGGQITLDAARAPHVEATLELPLPGSWRTAPDTLGAWREVRRNLATNANMARKLALEGSGTGTIERTTTMRRQGPASCRIERITGSKGASLISALNGDSRWNTAEAGVHYCVSAWVYWESGTAPEFRALNGSWQSAGITVHAQNPKPARRGEWQQVYFVLSTTTPANGVRVYDSRNDASAYYVADVLIEAAPAPEAWFSPSTPPPPHDLAADVVTAYRHRWTGTPDASPSVLEAAPVTSHGGPVWTPDPAALELLDPRQSPAPRIVITAASGSTSRRFDLHVRDRAVNASKGTVSVSLASDEALLADIAPLWDDLGAFAYQHSLGSVAEYVLQTVLKPFREDVLPPANPASGIDVTRYSTTTNLHPNPNAADNTAGWGAIGLGSYVRATGLTWPKNAGQTGHRLNGSASTDNTYIQFQWGKEFAGRRMLFRAEHRNGGSLNNPGVNASRMHIYYSVDGGHTFVKAGDVGGNTGANAHSVLSVVADIPRNANVVLQRLYHGHRSADSVFWSDVQARDFDGDPADVDYWDGNTPNTDVYEYAWQGDVLKSPATRTAKLDRPADALRWRAGTTALEFLQPLLQAHGLRLVCDEQRAWTIRDETYTAPGALTLRQSAEIISADEVTSRAGGAWFDARVTRYRWTDVQGTPQLREDVYALPGYTKVTTLDLEATYPGPGRSEYAVRRAQTIGREVTVEAVADWTARAEQPVTVTLEHAAPLVGVVQSVTFDLATDRMMLTTRAGTPSPAAASSSTRSDTDA